MFEEHTLLKPLRIRRTNCPSPPRANPSFPGRKHRPTRKRLRNTRRGMQTYLARSSSEPAEEIGDPLGEDRRGHGFLLHARGKDVVGVDPRHPSQGNRKRRHAEAHEHQHEPTEKSFVRSNCQVGGDRRQSQAHRHGEGTDEQQCSSHPLAHDQHHEDSGAQGTQILDNCAPQ